MKLHRNACTWLYYVHASECCYGKLLARAYSYNVFTLAHTETHTNEIQMCLCTYERTHDDIQDACTPSFFALCKGRVFDPPLRETLPLHIVFAVLERDQHITHIIEDGADINL